MSTLHTLLYALVGLVVVIGVLSLILWVIHRKKEQQKREGGSKLMGSSESV